MAREQVLDMTKGKPAALLLRFAVPLFLGNLLQQLYNLADTSIAGHLLGDTALSQIGATAALYSLITNLAFGLNNGLALTVSRSFGAGNEKKLKESVCWMVILSFLSAIIMTVAFLWFEPSLLTILKVPKATYNGAFEYFKVILIGIPFMMAYNLEAGLLQSIGNSKTPLLFLLFSSVLNVFLDILFLKPMAMGIQGAAIATVLSQGISALFGLVYIWKNYSILHFSRKELHVSKKFIWDMYAAGLSMALMSTIYNIGSVIMQGGINALGSTYIAAQVGGRRLAEFFYIPGLALGTSMANFSSQNHGAGERERIRKGIRIAILIYGVWWLTAVFFVFTCSTQAVELITGSKDIHVVLNAVLYLKISIPMIPPMAVLVIIRNAMQGMQYCVSPLVCSSLELLGKILFTIFVIPIYGYLAVCICEPVTWVVCCIFILTAYYFAIKK